MEVSAVNTSVADNSFDDSSGSLSQRSPFEAPLLNRTVLGLEPVPEPTSSIPLILALYLCLFKFKQKTFLRKKNALATNANSV